MFSVGTPELIVIAIIALFVVGPRRLPEILRGVAYVYKNFMKAIEELKRELEEDLEEVEDLNPKRQIEKKWKEILEEDEDKEEEEKRSK